MRDEDKTKDQLLTELRDLRRKLDQQKNSAQADRDEATLTRDGLRTELATSRKDLSDSRAETAAAEKSLADSEESLRISELNLEAAKERYNILGDLIPFGIWTADSTGQINFLSDAFLEMSGFSQKDMDQINWVDHLARPAVKNALSDWSSSSCERDIWEVEHDTVSQDGRVYSILVRGVPILDKKGEVLSWLGINLDISKRKQYENDLHRHKEEMEQLVQERTKALEQTRNKAEEANRAKSEFLANMSHEIRTPLNGIIGMLQLALTRSQESRVKEYLGYGIQSADHLLDLINDVLDLSKIESGRFEPDMHPFSLREVLESCLEPLSLKAGEKSLSLNLTVAEDVPDELIADSGHVRQIMVNLVNNAVKFTEQGRIDIMVKNLAIDENEAKLAFEVADTGIGIPAEKLDAIFENFEQVHSSAHIKFGGTGLGLAITKKLIKQMNGDITVKSEFGRGSTFTYTAVFERQQDGQAEAKDIESKTPHPDRPLKILLAEDDPINRMVGEDILAERGHEVVMAENGEEALEKLAANEFDLVLMDIRMPRMNGDEAVKKIRAGFNGVKNDIPVIALTAYALKQDKERLSDLFDGYLTKPIKIEDLDRILAGIESQT